MGVSDGSWSHFAMSVFDVIFEFLAEEAYTADDRAGSSIAKGAERLSADIIANIDQQIDILLAPLAMLQALQDLGQPVGSLATGRTFSAGLVAIELGHAQNCAHDTGILVKDNDPT